MAIAWLYRDDYRMAGFPMLPVIEPDGRKTGRQAVVYAAALLPASLLPTLIGLSGTAYFDHGRGARRGIARPVDPLRAVAQRSLRPRAVSGVHHLPAAHLARDDLGQIMIQCTTLRHDLNVSS